MDISTTLVIFVLLCITLFICLFLFNDMTYYFSGDIDDNIGEYPFIAESRSDTKEPIENEGESGKKRETRLEIRGDMKNERDTKSERKGEWCCRIDKDGNFVRIVEENKIMMKEDNEGGNEKGDEQGDEGIKILDNQNNKKHKKSILKKHLQRKWKNPYGNAYY